jgi:endonuclease V-like protein UPF0215 family
MSEFAEQINDLIASASRAWTDPIEILNIEVDGKDITDATITLTVRMKLARKAEHPFRKIV